MQNFWLFGVHIVIYGAAAIAVAAPLDSLMVAVGLTLIWISVIDCRSFEIPDLASVVLFILSGIKLWAEDENLVEHIFGAMLWPLIFYFISKTYSFGRGREGLGFGDVKLMIAIGFLCGFSGAVHVVLIAAISGIATLVVITALRSDPETSMRERLSRTALAFAPFLCFAAWVVALPG